MIDDKLAKARKDGGKLYTVDTPRGDALDVVGARYDIALDKPLPDLATDIGAAYQAIDRTGEYNNIFCYVGNNGLPFRDRATEMMQKGTVPHLIRCHATAPVTFSTTKQTHRAFILQKPEGKRLSEILEKSGPLPDTFIAKQVISPIVKLISELESNGINHGCINADTVYFDKEITVSENSAVSSGYSQLVTYEAPDRNMAMLASKGAGDTSCDYYALGILALHLTLGYLPNQELTKQELVEKIIKVGAYNAFMPKIELNEPVQDFLRGVLNENRSERWNSTQVNGWLGGKRYTVVTTAAPKESVRPFEFRGQNLFTRQQIAYALCEDWKLSKTLLSPFKLMKWLESNIKKTDICAQVDRIIPIGDDESKSRALKDEELARLIVTLDPNAPMRYRLVSSNVDGFGTAIANAYRTTNSGKLQQLVKMIELNLPSYADGLLRDEQNPVSALMLLRIQSMRPIMKVKTIGFGFERLLYQLNPSLSCQQSLLLPHYVYSLADLMQTLDGLSFKHAKTDSLVDRHIAAFITSRLDYNREIRIVELSKFDDLVDDDRLIMLKILTMAQQKLRNQPFPALTKWAVEMISPTIDKIYSKSKREKIREKILLLESKGILEPISFLICDKEMFANDRKSYGRAKALYRFHLEMLNFNRDQNKTRLKARIRGQEAAWYIGMLALAISVYFNAKVYI